MKVVPGNVGSTVLSGKIGERGSPRGLTLPLDGPLTRFHDEFGCTLVVRKLWVRRGTVGGDGTVPLSGS